MRPHATRRPRLEPRPKPRPGRARAPGFTLLELLIVMTIVGIVLSLILTAAMDGIRRAEERATQALILKLETGMNDRIEALLNQRADVNNAHGYVGSLWNPSVPSGRVLQTTLPQTIAQIEMLKAELPDVFLVQPSTSNPDALYPFNFAALPYTAGTPLGILPAGYESYLVPMGAGVLDAMASNSYGAGAAGVSPASYGIFGVSYSALAGFNKQLNAAAILKGATPPTPPNAGYDGVDNNGNGLIDELSESGASVQSAALALISHHTHKTARAEALYAILVEGQGPFGSVFSRDDFSDKEVQDTDGDGLLEFVDAWGEPLQWYRWPIGYESDAQIGLRPFPGNSSPRTQNPLDPNQQLVNPAWWWNSFNNATLFDPLPGSPPISSGAAFFHRSFFSLVDPSAGTAPVPWTPGQPWGRTDARRAYYSRPLILSGGEDKLPGVPVLDPTYFSNIGFPGSPGLTQQSLQIESQAAPWTPNRSDPYYLTPAVGDAPLSTAIQAAGSDDITTHNIQGPGGATQ